LIEIAMGDPAGILFRRLSFYYNVINN